MLPILEEVAAQYLSKAIYDRVKKKEIDFDEISEYATEKVKSYAPCWDGEKIFIRNWACIFDEAVIHKASNLGKDDINVIIPRYNNAIEELKERGEEFCITKAKENGNQNNIGALKNLFRRNQLKHHRWENII